jgi:hypothetical protein
VEYVGWYSVSVTKTAQAFHRSGRVDSPAWRCPLGTPARRLGSALAGIPLQEGASAAPSPPAVAHACPGDKNRHTTKEQDDDEEEDASMHGYTMSKQLVGGYRALGR